MWTKFRKYYQETGRRAMSKLTHIDSTKNLPKMVNVGDKVPTKRTALARSIVIAPEEMMTALQRSKEGDLVGPKGPVFATAIIAGVMGAKRTSELLPFCHPLPIDDCQITIEPKYNTSELHIFCQVQVTHKTGVEMEALTGASVASLCIYDMCKALSHDIVISQTELLAKTGGKQDFHRDNTVLNSSN